MSCLKLSYFDNITLKVNTYNLLFGQVMLNRHGDDDKYRFAYNGMELDNEVSGDGNSYTTEFRGYDPRLGRWKSLDPLMAQFPWMSPFVAFNNNPIYFVDPYGLESDPPVKTNKTIKGSASEKASEGEKTIPENFKMGDIHTVDYTEGDVLKTQYTHEGGGRIKASSFEKGGSEIASDTRYLEGWEKSGSAGEIASSDDLTMKDPIGTLPPLRIVPGESVNNLNPITTELKPFVIRVAAAPQRIKIDGGFVGGSPIIGNVTPVMNQLNNIIPILISNPNARLTLRGNVVARKTESWSSTSSWGGLPFNQLALAINQAISNLLIGSGVRPFQIVSTLGDLHKAFSVDGTLTNPVLRNRVVFRKVNLPQTGSFSVGLPTTSK